MEEMTTKEVQQVSLEILKDVHEFCVKNGINYSLSGGTLLGAIRHNGFIPWDDDIDIQMPRPDYDRFIHTYTSQKGYTVFCRELPESEKKNMTYAYARVCDMVKTFVDTGTNPWISGDIGVWIDIFPCDGMPSDASEAKVHLDQVRKAVRYSRWLVLKDTPWKQAKRGRNLMEKVKFVIKKPISFFVRKSFFDKMLALRKSYDYTTSAYFFATTINGFGEWQPKVNMSDFELHRFEDTQFYIMSDYGANLKSLYGDYMTIPPENKRIVHSYNKYYWK